MPDPAHHVFRRIGELAGDQAACGYAVQRWPYLRRRAGRTGNLVTATAGILRQRQKAARRVGATLMLWSQWRADVVMADPPPDALVVGVTGHPWWWEVRYRHPDSGADIRLANEIRVPLGRTVMLGLTSADVIHSVWLPQLAGKMDTVPGRVNRLVLRTDRAGIYRSACAEFCGEQHARMGLRLVAMEPAAFSAWLRDQALDARPAATPQQERGRDAFLNQRCGACHTVRGVTREGRLAPDLTHVASRVALGAGLLPNGAAALRQWVAHTQDLKPGARMPSYGHLDAPTLDAIAAWLGRLE